MGNKTILGIVGNPNCGKSTLFNRMTGGRQQVGNWPGVTVERKEGTCRVGDREIVVVDLPGVYTLAAQSPDELIARNFVLAGDYHLIVNIVDASNLERNLYLTVQLMEMRIPMMVVMNMMDIAQERGIVVDIPALARELGCAVITTIAKSQREVTELLATLDHLLNEDQHTLPTLPPLPTALAAAVNDLRKKFEKDSYPVNMDNGWVALKLIEGDGGAPTPFWNQAIDDQVLQWRATLETDSGDEPDIMVADARYHFIGQMMDAIVRHRGEASHVLTERLDHWALHRWLGIPIFLGMLYLMFMFTINLGGAFIDFFKIFFGALFVDGTRELLSQWNTPELIIVLAADGLGGGIQTLATFIPPIGFMFLFLSWLEDSGYMARAAFILDRFLRFIGLPGKAFIPMMVGFGCNVPAILGTRTLENQRDRIMTIMMNPFMSCGARMPVYALFMAAFFPQGGQNIVFGLYLTGIVFAIITGLTLRHSLLKGEISKFVMELPLYHLPLPSIVMFHTWDRLKGFITRAGKLLIPVIIILSFLNSLGTDATFGNAHSEKSVLSMISRQATPLFTPMGIYEDNWPATVGLFIGLFAKEAVVGTLDAMYNQIGKKNLGSKNQEPFDLIAKFSEAIASIGEHFFELGATLLDPLKLTVSKFDTLEDAANTSAVNRGTFGAMTKLFDGRIGAIAYLLFVLLYFPCVAATAAIYQETDWRWTIFAGVWTTSLAWSAATLFYQVGTFARHPDSSLFWIFLLIGMWTGIAVLLRHFTSKYTFHI